MHRSLSAFGVLSLSLAALAIPAAAGAQARVAEQKIMGPPSPEAVLTGEPGTAVGTSNKKTRALSPMESALQGAAKELTISSRKGLLVHPASGARISQGASEAVLSVMSKPTGEAAAQVRNALMMSGNDDGDVDHLMSELPEVISDPNPGRVRAARKAYDEFMKKSSESYRVNPPAEAMAIDAALARMNVAESGVRDDERARKEEQKARKSQPKKNDRKAVAEEKKRAAEAKKKREADDKKRAAEEKKRQDDAKKAAEKAAKNAPKTSSK